MGGWGPGRLQDLLAWRPPSTLLPCAGFIPSWPGLGTRGSDGGGPGRAPGQEAWLRLPKLHALGAKVSEDHRPGAPAGWA